MACAILILYMTATAAEGGLGFTTARAAGIYGAYTASVYMMSVPGGGSLTAFWGAPRRSCWRSDYRTWPLLDGLSGAFKFLPRPILIVLGTGLLKPNVSSMVGSLYGPTDRRRDSGFSIFYMGINLGATIAPFVCGFWRRTHDSRPFCKASHRSPKQLALGFRRCRHWNDLGLVQYLLTEGGSNTSGTFPKGE